MPLEKRILIVDDDDTIRTLVLTVLRRRGYGLDSAPNGVDALEKLSTCRYALVVLDLMMPRLSGYGVLEYLAKQPAGLRPLVLVLTAGLEPKPFEQGFVVGTIHKPFDISLLVDTVAGCLSAYEAQEQLDTCVDTASAAGGAAEKQEPN
jgi:DNA-binding response OmpR family regulator